MSEARPKDRPNDRPRRSVFALPLMVGAALLVLMGVSVGLAFLPLGSNKLFANLAVAVVQAGLVATILMRLDRASPLVRLAAGGALLWIAFLFTLAGADYFSRPT